MEIIKFCRKNRQYLRQNGVTNLGYICYKINEILSQIFTKFVTELKTTNKCKVLKSK